MKRAKQMAPEERKQHLLALAIEVFAEKGLEGAKHGDLAKAAGVAIPTVHSYFKTRQDLVISVLDEVGRFVSNECTRPFVDGDSYEQRMQDSGEFLVEKVAQSPQYFKVWIMWGACFAEPYQGRYADYMIGQNQLLCQIIAGKDADLNDPALQAKGRILEGMTMLFTQLLLREEAPDVVAGFIEDSIKILR